jgi:flagellar hook-associated protein 2
MPAINFGGLASGLDTEAIITALVDAARRPITLLEAKKADLNTQKNSYSTISSTLSRLKTAASALDTESEFYALTGSSNDTTALSVTASSSANVGSYDMQITNLAQSQRNYSDPFAAKDTAGVAGSGNLQIQVGTDPAVDITIEATDTLENVAAKINSSAAEVNASIVFDGSQYRLLVQGKDTGAANSVTFVEDAGVLLDLDDVVNNQAQDAEDATVLMDGITFTNATNQFTEMLPGVTIDLHQETTGNVTVQVAHDSDAMADKIQAILDEYNSAISFFKSQFTFSGEARSDTLMGDPSARAIKSQIQTAMGGEVSDLTTYTILAQVGIDSDRDGTLTLNRAEFQEALAADSEAVMQLFTYDDGDDNADRDGIAVRLVNTLEGILQSPDGVIPARQEGLGDTIKSINKRIETEEDRIAAYEERLRKKFVALEQAMAEYQSVGDYLSQNSLPSLG